jgi:hypothetical protein
MLARIYAELDLVAAECIRAGVFAGLTHPQLAAVLAAFVYEARRSDDSGHRPRMPDARTSTAMTDVRRIWREVSLVERDLPAAWAGQKLSKLNEPGRFTVTAVTRLGSARVVEPDLVGQEGDVLYFMIDASATDALQARLSGQDDAVHH